MVSFCREGVEIATKYHFVVAKWNRVGWFLLSRIGTSSKYTILKSTLLQNLQKQNPTTTDFNETVLVSGKQNYLIPKLAKYDLPGLLGNGP